MTSATPIPAADETVTAAKGAWIEPSVNRIDVGEAEAGDGVGTDGGFIS